MTNRSIFFGEDGLLRSGWRFAVFALLFVAGGTLFGAAVVALLYSVSPQARPATSTFLVVNGLASLAVALAAGWACGKYLERLQFSALGASVTVPGLKNFLVGLLLGSVTFALGAGIGIVFDGLGFAANPVQAVDIGWTLLISFIVFATAAAFEEALFRGYMLQTFVRSELTIFGVVLTSLLFATVHNANPAATWLSWINTFIAGVWFAVAYLKTRSLWLPFGLHLAWNWTQGSVFGVEVSGLTDIVRAPLMRESDAGPAWLTGGDYGIEGGVITTVAILASIAALYFMPFGAPPNDKASIRSSGS